MTTELEIVLEGEGAFADLDPEKCVGGTVDEVNAEGAPTPRGLTLGQLFRVVALTRGTTSGSAAVAIAVSLPDGTIALGETTAHLFCTAADAIRARYPDFHADQLPPITESPGDLRLVLRTTIDALDKLEREDPTNGAAQLAKATTCRKALQYWIGLRAVGEYHRAIAAGALCESADESGKPN